MQYSQKTPPLVSINDETELLAIYYKVYFRTVYATVKNILSPNHISSIDDTVHEIFIKLKKHIHKLKDWNSIDCEKYIATAARNQTRTFLHKINAEKKGRNKMELGYGNTPKILNSHHGEFEARIDAQIYLNLLTPNQAAVFSLFIYGYNVKDIAQELDISDEAAKSRLKLARAKIRKKYKKY